MRRQPFASFDEFAFGYSPPLRHHGGYRARQNRTDVSLETFETDWQRQWVVERGIEIISEASRHLPDEIKTRRPEIPWKKVAGIGNVLRHDYESVAAPIIWKLAQIDLGLLELICRDELRALRDDEP